jgi:hypothetical protein
MNRSTISAALVGLGLLAAAASPALAQSGTVIVPAPPPVQSPSASPPTVVTPGAGGTTVTVPPGSTVTVTPPAAPSMAVAVKPWCGGEWSSMGGSNFGGCPGNLPR